VRAHRRKEGDSIGEREPDQEGEAKRPMGRFKLGRGTERGVRTHIEDG